MCGIVGIAVDKDRREIGRVLQRMNAAIQHRGPDDDGVHVADLAGLAMRRLSIIDLESGHQPMCTADGVAIVFNGEIYNYRRLRDELIAKGYVFKTRSDTEVILNLYHAEGIGGFQKLNGMFAIAIHDPRSGEIILARDQIGIKPLYYLDKDSFLFASEIKAILAALPGKPQVNPQAVWDYLSLRYSPPPHTIWRGITKLQPGHVLRYSMMTRQGSVTCFWQPDLTPEPFDPGRDYAGEFEQRFLAAVESHILASDVPVGEFLSGGLDSGAICAASVELGHRDFHTFSIGGEAAGDNDELPLARLVSRRFATNHHEINITKQVYFGLLDEVAWHFDEPYGDETGVAMWLLSRDARQHVKVAMSGEGADELLLGYNPTLSMKNLALINRRYGRWPPAAIGFASHLFTGRRAKVLSAIAADGPAAYNKGAAVHIAWSISDDEKKHFWRGGPERPTHDLVSSWYTLGTRVNPLAQNQQASFQSWLVEDLLMKSDKMAMASSLEVRVPFLHLPLVEWCQRSPMEIRIGRSSETGEIRSKAILRDFVAKRLPKEVLNAPKRGFPVPTIRWFGEMLREQGRLPVTSRTISDWIRMDRLDTLLSAGISGERTALAKLWGVFMLDRWFKIYVD